MQFDPLLHHRRSIRLKGYDYSQKGAYFITIICFDKICRFGRIINNEFFDESKLNGAEMELNAFGQIAYNEWYDLPNRFNNIELDCFQIMPNHLHGILILNDKDIHIENDTTNERAGVNPATIMTSIVRVYKSVVANESLKLYKLNNETMGKFWHRNYYEHIIRNEKSYEKISNYIINNPINWLEDKFYDEKDC